MLIIRILNMDAISLFSGAGGDSLGMKNAGLNVIAFSEFNKDAIQTHLAAFPDSVWLGSKVKGDITKILDAEFEPYRGKIKVIFAGFPCQGFSNGGKNNEIFLKLFNLLSGITKHILNDMFKLKYYKIDIKKINELMEEWTPLK